MKLVSLLVLLSAFTLAHAEYRSYFSPEDNLDQVLQSELKKAKKSIDIAIYTFKSKPTRQILVDRLNKGVKVNILIRLAGKKKTMEFVQPLFNAGAKIRYVSKTNHHKYAIIDDKVLVNSSGNFNNSYLQRTYDENLFVCNDCPKMIQEFKKEFNHLNRYSNKLFGKNDVSSSTVANWQYPNFNNQYALFTSVNFAPFFNKRTKKISFKVDRSQTGAVESELITQIDNADSSIKIATGHFRSWPLFKALERAVKRGIKVEMILDSQEFITKKWQAVENKKIQDCLDAGNTNRYCHKSGVHFARKAHRAGVDVKIKYYALIWNFIKAPQMHHKYMIIDDQTLYSGSYNWSQNAEFSTFENISVVSDETAVSDYTQNFHSIRNKRSQQFPNLLKQFRNATENLKINFDAHALSIPQIDQLRNVACQKCPDVFCPTTRPNSNRRNTPSSCKVKN